MVRPSVLAAAYAAPAAEFTPSVVVVPAGSIKDAGPWAGPLAGPGGVILPDSIGVSAAKRKGSRG